MTLPTAKQEDNFLTRRELLKQCGMGMGALGLAQLIGQSAFANNPQSGNPLAPKRPPFPAKAKRVIHLFMNGGPSAMDSFDPTRLYPILVFEKVTADRVSSGGTLFPEKSSLCKHCLPNC